MGFRSVSKWLSGFALTFVIYAVGIGPLGWIANHAPGIASEHLTTAVFFFYVPLLLICNLDPSGMSSGVLDVYLNLWRVNFGFE
jgi:hypothetical protein